MIPIHKFGSRRSRLGSTRLACTIFTRRFMAVCRLLPSIKFNREVTPQKNCRQRRQSSNVRLPLELRSDRRETSATRVSEDLQRSSFRRRKIFLAKIFGSKSQIFVNLVRFWRTYGRTDVKISFLVKFCSR